MTLREELMAAFWALWQQASTLEGQAGVEARWHLSVALNWLLEALGEEDHPA